MDEIEINFRLDRNGRTIPQQDTQEEVLMQTDSLKYETQTVQTCLQLDDDDDDDKLLDDLLFDCEIADSGLMPRTFWMPAVGMNPRFSLEQMALNVFQHHTATSDDAKTRIRYDPATSGAEWWVQIRPSPEKTGRYAMVDKHDSTGDDNDDDDKMGISFHWDKDEDLRLVCGGNTYIHPHLSTVTYLTSLGAPTLTVNCRVNNWTGEWMVPADQASFVSWPRVGKHLSFDGRFLHAAPHDLMEDGVFCNQCQFVPTQNAQQNKRLQRRRRRVTLLVNIWLNFRPFNVNPFPETMIDKMSGYQAGRLARLLFPTTDDSQHVTTKQVQVVNGRKHTNDTASDDSNDPGLVQEFSWPMGGDGSGEVIRMQIPLQEIQSVASQGGNVQITWTKQDSTPAGVVLEKNASVQEGNDTKRQKVE